MADVASCSTTKKTEISSSGKLCLLDLPGKTSDWLTEENFLLVQKLFKSRLCSFSVDKIFWPDSKHSTTLDSWITVLDKVRPPRGATYQRYLRYLDDVIALADKDNLTEWYDGKTDSELVENTVDYLALPYIRMDDRRERDLACSAQFEVKIKKWLINLKLILEKKPSAVCEKAFEDCFRNFIEIAGLHCHSGDILSTWKFGYDDLKDNSGESFVISTVPNLIVYNISSGGKQLPLAVVEVKRFSECPGTWQSESSDRVSTSEGKVAKLSKADDPLTAAIKTEYPNGNPRRLSQEQRNWCQMFLPQLLGDAVAATDNQTLPFRTVAGTRANHKSVIGVAVVGFQVHFVNFIAATKGVRLREKWSMHEVPLTRGVGLDILVSEPLDMLKRNDRNKLFKALFAMGSLNYDKW